VGLFVIGRTSDRQVSRGYATQQGGNEVALTWIRTHDWDAEDWRNKASCRDTSPELFFPIGTTGLALDQIDAAKHVCGACPVAHQCLEFALATNQEAGVWGGMTEDERRRLRKGLDVEVTTTATRLA
jgi:WhiB family transcriptional regulator, redox-sensing transcriptional regulator